MIHHLVLFKLKPETSEETVEMMMRETRMQLLKIPSVLRVQCGKRVEEGNPWQFFLSVDVDSMDHLESYASHPIHIKFVEKIIRPHVVERLALDYEMDPGKDVRFS